jgi:nicotinamide-nucleotide amidase
MAVGAQRVLDADWGVATTGVAGPEPQDGTPVGCVFVAVAEPSGSVVVERHDLPGGRPEIRAAAVDAALALLAYCLDTGAAAERPTSVVKRPK